MVYNGNFEGNGTFITAFGNYDTEVNIEGGSFRSEKGPIFEFYAYGLLLDVKLSNCSLVSKDSTAILIGDSSENDLMKKPSKLTIDGCSIEGKRGALGLVDVKSLPRWNFNIVNCTLKALQGEKKQGAIWSKYYEETYSNIKKNIVNYTGDVFLISDFWDGYKKTEEHTYQELVFKDKKLILAKGNPNDMKDSLVDDSNNTENDSENNIQNKPTTPNKNEQSKETNAVVNDTKLPQTGEETNAFASWLSIVILLGIFWLGSMLLIEYEKRKMKSK